MTKNYLFQFCYLIRLEYEQCSEMCVWIVTFDQKLRMGLFFGKKVSAYVEDNIMLLTLKFYNLPLKLRLKFIFFVAKLKIAIY